MKSTFLGTSELSFTQVGIGSFAMGGEGWKASWGPQDDADSIAAIHAGLEQGANWIDTAPVYGLGHGETVVGQAIKGLAQRPLIATKWGRVGDASSIRGDLSTQSLHRECDDSLHRLGIEVIDLYQIHWPDPDEQIEEAWGAMADLVTAGKVRYLGVSNFSAAQMERLRAIHPIASLQPPYSMLQRDVETDILPYCLEHQIGVIAYSPMYKGLLTGAFSAERAANLPASDHRRNVPLFNPPRLNAALGLADELNRIAAKQGRTAAELAIAWVTHHPAVTAAIVGLRRAGQADVLSAGDWDLDDDTYAEAQQAVMVCEQRLADI